MGTGKPNKYMANKICMLNMHKNVGWQMPMKYVERAHPNHTENEGARDEARAPLKEVLNALGSSLSFIDCTFIFMFIQYSQTMSLCLRGSALSF